MALLALLAYGLAPSSPTRRSTTRSRAASAGRRRRSTCRRSTGAARSVARRLPRQGRRAQLLGLLVRPVPRRVAAARALARELTKRGGGTVLGVDVLDVDADAREFIDEYGLTYPHAARQGRATGAERLRRRRLPRDVRDRQARAASPRCGAGRSTTSSCARNVAAAARGAGVRRARRAARRCAAPLAAPAAAALPRCPQTTLGDLEDEVMCPVCGTPLRLATEAPQAKRERAFIQRLIDRLQVEGRDQGGARGPVRRRACLRRPRTRASTLAAYLVPALALLLAPAGSPSRSRRWRARRRRPGRPASSAPTSAAPTPSALDADLERYDL